MDHHPNHPPASVMLDRSGSPSPLPLHLHNAHITLQHACMMSPVADQYGLAPHQENPAQGAVLIECLSRLRKMLDGIDAYHAMVTSAGANITEEIQDQPWRMREFETRDPDGNVLLFGEHLDHVEMREKPGHRHLWDSFWYHGIFHPHDHEASKEQSES